MENYVGTFCKYCIKEPILNFEEVVKCKNCDAIIHIACSKRQAVPGGIYGDTFYHLICQDCSETKNEVFIRQRMTWFQIIVLIMYHLHHKTAGIGKKGFFHWRIHLVNIIEKKWDILFPKDFKRRKNWMGTISGALSHFSPCFFTSGTSILGSNGWWKLTFPDLTPTTSILIYNEIVTKKDSTLKNFSDIVYVKKMICKYVPKLLSIRSSSYYTVVHERDEDKIKRFIEEINMNLDDELDLSSVGELFEISPRPILHHNIQISEVFSNIINCVTKKRKKKIHLLKESKIGFKQSSDINFYKFWRGHRRNIKQNINIRINYLRINEENAAYHYMFGKKYNNRFELALKRKLHVRYLKHQYDLKILNVDERKMKNISSHHFSKFTNNRFNINIKNERIMATGTIRMFQFITSPYTNRWLKPFIKRDLNPKSLWIKLMQELMEKVSEKQKIFIYWPIASLDYVYVQANHIPAVNSLCQKFFWPGIDMSEALQYPEFSCIVLYKKLIIAFGFMIPNVKYNEAYISFLFTRPEWRRNGIAKFILYHLINTCMGKDVTLHVAIDNPAIFLYQKFGFKVEKTIYNFYDCYFQEESKQCRHAFLLRLEK